MKRVLAMLLFAASAAAAETPVEELTVEGTLTREDHRTYLERPFEVPEGIGSLTVDIRHDGSAERTVIDVGLRDPAGFRGWTGSNKSRIVISAFDSTPGYRNGPISSGSWALLLGVPNLREGVETRYRATIRLYENHDLAAALNPGDDAFAAGKRWYRGDLHAHSGHSDGYCASLH
ncbi:MAG: PHP domain-containing protein, partial [Woeseiaceae bacterium]